ATRCVAASRPPRGQAGYSGIMEIRQITSPRRQSSPAPRKRIRLSPYEIESALTTLGTESLPDAPAILAAPKTRTSGQAPSPTVLVVDDEPDTRLMLRALLEFYGYDVVEAGDGTEALRHLTSRPVFALLTDLYMPGMDGIQLLRQIGNDRTRAKRVVAMSGVLHRGQASSAAAASLLGADAVLDKPFSRHQLL